MAPSSAKRLFRYGFVAFSLLALCSCVGLFGPAKPSAKTGKAPKVEAAAYVEHLSVAHVVLENGGTVADITDDAKIVEAYTKQKKVKPGSLILAVLDYTGSDGKSQRAIAPIGDKANFNALSNLLTPLNTTSYKLKDVRVMGVVVAPGMPMKITGQETPAAKQAIDMRYQAIAGSAHKIAAPQEAKLQLKLLRFFMAAQHRDAAYICADNAKRILSALAQDKAHADAANALAKELEAAESELRQQMPY